MNLDAFDYPDLLGLACTPAWKRAQRATALGGALVAVALIGACGMANDPLKGSPFTMIVCALLAALIAFFVAQGARKSWTRVFLWAPVGGVVLATTAGTVCCTCFIDDMRDPCGAVFLVCVIVGFVPGCFLGALSSAVLWFPLRASSRLVRERRLDGVARADRANAIWLFVVSVVSGLAHAPLDRFYVGVWLAVLGVIAAARLAWLARREGAACRARLEWVRRGMDRGLRIDPSGVYLERAAESVDYRGEVRTWRPIARIDTCR